MLQKDACVVASTGKLCETMAKKRRIVGAEVVRVCVVHMHGSVRMRSQCWTIPPTPRPCHQN